MIKTTVLAIALALTAPFAVQAETVETKEYGRYKVSCEAATCGDFDVSFESGSDTVAQTRRTRTRTRRSSTSEGLFKDNFIGGGAGLFFGDGLDIGGLGHIFVGTRYNENFGAEVEFTLGFAGVDGFSSFGGDATATLLGFYLNPRYEYKFDNDITVFGAVGIGLNRISFDNDFGDVSDTDFDIQLKAGAMKPIGEKLNAYAQGRIQRTFDTFGIDGGILFNL